MSVEEIIDRDAADIAARIKNGLPDGVRDAAETALAAIDLYRWAAQRPGFTSAFTTTLLHSALDAKVALAEVWAEHAKRRLEAASRRSS